MPKITTYKQAYNEESAPGADAISKKEKEIYGDQEPTSWATAISWEMGGDDPLRTINCYVSEHQQKHLHYVTMGFSNLFYDEAFAEDEINGYGFELTFRHLPVQGDIEKPKWPAALLQNIARYVFSTHNVFEDYHYMNANGPLRLGTDSNVTAILFFTDPEMKEIDTPHGHLKFLQVFGITTEEITAIEEEKQTPEEILEKHRLTNPLLITDLMRK